MTDPLFDDLHFLSGGGTMGAAMRAHDWGATSLGSPDGWPQPLKTLVGVMLGADQPMFVAWGPKHTMLYNDRYAEILGGKHPAALGRPLLDVWREVADDLRPIVDQTYAGTPVHMADLTLMMERRGHREETHFAFSYTPIRTGGVVNGFFCACTETTDQVMAERSQRAAENALAESETRFRGMADNAPVMMWVTRPDGWCTYLNRRWYAFTGQAERAGEGLGWVDAVHPDDRAAAETAFLEANAEHRDYRVDFRLRRADGTYRWTIDAAAARFDADGVFQGYIGSVIDIDERREAELALQTSTVRAEALAAERAAILGQLAEGVIVTDRAGRITFVNDAAARIHGVASLDVEPDAYSETYHLLTLDREPYPSHELPLARAVLKSETVTEASWRICRPDGTEIVAVGSARPVLDARGGTIGAVLTLRDDTNRADAERLLRENQALLSRSNDELEAQVAQRTAERDRLWRNTQDIQVVIDGDGVFRAVNPAFTTMLGWSHDEVIDRTVFDFVLPEDGSPTSGALAHARQEALPTFENRYRHKDGGFRCISWVAAPEDGLIYASGRNVTAEKEQAAELEHTQEALRQAQKMEAVGQLTGGIAHDFNNLLTGVIGSLDMMQRRMAKGETDKVERYVTAAMTSANRAAALTHRLLAFSRRQPLDPKPVSANRLVSGMEELLRRTIGESVLLEIVTAGGLWQTLCDPHQLESAILNLAINARDAMPDGGKLTIETCNAHLDSAYASQSREVRPGQYVCICVTDTGTGMDKDTVVKVFEPFFTTKPIGQGTGLGLSMIYGFARQSEGYAKIYSEVGKGTTVKLYLPRYYGEAEDAEEAHAQLTEAHEAEDGEVVLVVEDETAVRDLVVDLLGELGYRAVEAADGPTGLKLLQSDMRVDLLVTDIGLPGLNGRQLTDAARAVRPDLRVLFMTGYAENATLANGFLEPGMEMITKPFAVEALATRIRDMLESK